jgi:aminoglycoside phosphotransferase (APT) family kinase protein
VEPALRRRVEERLGCTARDVVSIDEGWDSAVFEVDGEWIVRVPRRDEVLLWLRREAALLPVLAPALPLPVPRFEVVEDSGPLAFVAYGKLEGEPLDGSAARAPPGPSLARQLGAFLTALHSFPLGKVVQAGFADTRAAGWLEQQREFARRCEHEAIPLLEEDERLRARSLFAEFLSRWDSRLELVFVHGDLGPAHILWSGSTVSGVIDWSDARVGDPALDFAWLLHGTGAAFADALLGAYSGVETGPAFRARALFYHRLGPWHEVLYGLQRGRPDLVASGLSGVRQRLPPG